MVVGRIPNRDPLFVTQYLETNTRPLRQQLCVWTGPAEVVGELHPAVLHPKLLTDTPTAHHIFSCTVVAQSRCSLVMVYSHTLTSMHLHGFKSRSTLPAFRPITFTPHPRRAMSYTLQNLTPRTGTPSSPFPESVFQQSDQPCGDQRPQQSGGLTEIPPLTGYEPNRIAEDGESQALHRRRSVH